MDASNCSGWGMKEVLGLRSINARLSRFLRSKERLRSRRLKINGRYFLNGFAR